MVCAVVVAVNMHFISGSSRSSFTQADALTDLSLSVSHSLPLPCPCLCSQKLRIEDSPDQEAKTEAVPGSPETAQGSGSLGPDGSPSKVSVVGADVLVCLC